MASDLVRRILDWNQGRDPLLLQCKYTQMRASPFAFFRGSCHLFHEDWPVHTALDACPHTWISGDLHLENFGSYKGDNRLVYFDLNDFDEALLAPCGRDLARFSTSLRLAAQEQGLAAAEAESWLQTALQAYRAALQEGKARWLERDIATGAIGTLIQQVSRRKRRHLLERRTELKRGQRRLLSDGRHAVPATPREQAAVGRLLRRIGIELGREDWFEPLDVARRIAGIGSLGMPRYVALVAGKGSPDRNALLDIKQARPPSAAAALAALQPRWPNEAQRIVAIQRRAQAVSPALLRSVTLGRHSFVLRELQASEDRLSLNTLDRDTLYAALADLGRLIAWSHLRSSGRNGAATADEWMHWASRNRWIDDIVRYSRRYHAQATRDWHTFRKDFPA